MANFTVGLDLGSAADFSALVVVEHVYVLPEGVSLHDWRLHPDRHRAGLVEEKHVRLLRRWELGTPYPAVVADVASLMRSGQLSREGVLFVDGTGVGRAVMDMFSDAHEREPLGIYYPIGITVTAGHEINGWNVPKKDLFGAIQAPLQLGTLKIAGGLPLGDLLERELTNFRLKINASGRESVDYSRSSGDGHGDLVSALALALIGNNTLAEPTVIERPGVFVRVGGPLRDAAVDPRPGDYARPGRGGIHPGLPDEWPTYEQWREYVVSLDLPDPGPFRGVGSNRVESIGKEF